MVKNKTKFFPDKKKDSDVSTFFEILWNINLKEQPTKNNPHKNKNKPLKYPGK